MVARRYNLLNFYLEDLYDLKKAQLQQHEYSVTKQQLAQPEEYSLLNSLSKRSILCILTHKFHQSLPPSHQSSASQTAEQPSEKKVLFSLPYAEFISER